MTASLRRAADPTRLNPAEVLATGRSYRFISAQSANPSISGNAIVRSENLHVLKSLQEPLRGSVRCIYIDPPYNNSESYTHYRDRSTRAGWLSLMKPRLAIMNQMLSADGSLWISIDDSEVHHLRILGEEIFGRQNFVATIIWNHRKTRENRRPFSANHEYIICFAKDISIFKKTRNPLAATGEILARYKNPDADPRGPWQSVSANVQDGHGTPAQFYTLRSPSGESFDPPRGRCWVYNSLRMQKEIAAGNVYFGPKGKSVPRLKKFLSEAKLRVAPSTLWEADVVGTTDGAKKHILNILANGAVFDTPKPEQLLHRIISIATNPGELVLDAYLGSGTTASVAHKMGRAYLGIEQGPHAVTHCCARLKAVVAGEAGGISSLIGWSGGGGFSFFDSLGPPPL